MLGTFDQLRPVDFLSHDILVDLVAHTLESVVAKTLLMRHQLFNRRRLVELAILFGGNVSKDLEHHRNDNV